MRFNGRIFVYLAENNTSLFFEPNKSKCLDLIVQILDRTPFCFNMTYQLHINTSYVINRNLSVYSRPVYAPETFNLYLASSNCCNISFVSSFLPQLNNQSTVRIDLNATNTTNTTEMRIPIRLGVNCEHLSVFELNYTAEFDTISANYLNLSDTNNTITSNSTVKGGKYLTTKLLSLTVNRTASINFIRFDFINLEKFQFYFLSLKVRRKILKYHFVSILSIQQIYFLRHNF